MDSTVTYLAYLQMYESEKFGTELVSFEILLILNASSFMLTFCLVDTYTCSVVHHKRLRSITIMQKVRVHARSEFG